MTMSFMSIQCEDVGTLLHGKSELLSQAAFERAESV